MPTPENAFGLGLLQSHIETMTERFYVSTGCETTLDGKHTYTALVIPREEYDEALNVMNAARYSEWLRQVEHAKAFDEPQPLWERLEYLDNAYFCGDPRYCERDSAWQALVDAEEAAARLIDGACDEQYIPLDEPHDSWQARLSSHIE